MNNVSLIGRLTRDPELVTTQGGTEICNVRIALDLRGQDGAVYTDVKCFGKQGLAVAEHKRKGDQIAVTGRPSSTSGRPLAARSARSCT